MLIPGHPRISADPAICGGKPCVAGTRMRVLDIIGLLAAGAPESEIVADYPWVGVDDIRACLAYAAEQVDHRVAIAAE